MSPQAEEVLRNLRALPSSDREEVFDTIAEEALEMNGEHDPSERDWNAEIDRRIAEYDAGSATTMTWEQIRDNARRKYGFRT